MVCGGNGALGEIAEPGGCAIADTENVERASPTAIRGLLTDETRYQHALHWKPRRVPYRDWAAYWKDLERMVK